MNKIDRDLSDVISLKEKEKLLKEIHKEELLNLFKDGYKHNYKPVHAKKAVLDQQISISIGKDEKDKLQDALNNIKRVSKPISISTYVRNKSISEIDLGEWYQKAHEGLIKLTSKEYDVNLLNKDKKHYIKLLDNIDLNDETEKENKIYYESKLSSINDRLDEIAKVKPGRNFRLTGRVTFSEANIVRWKAARLSLSVADYMRFLIFDYLPYSEFDKHLTIDQRKRFYISIIDVYTNGWGTPPKVNDCPNCARLEHDIQVLREQLHRYKSVT